MALVRLHDLVVDDSLTGARARGGGRGKPRIAFLVDWLEDPYQDAVLSGAAAAAREHDVTLITFPGGVLNAPHRNGAHRNHLFDLVDPGNYQGLIVMSGTLGNYSGSAEVERLCARFSHLPIAAIGTELKGASNIVVDNAAGMRSAVEHLIDIHRHRRIAFIRGPETNGEAEARYRAYREVLESRGIEFDPRLVAPGDFQHQGGVQAVKLWLDERELLVDDIDAVAGAADLMVAGARDELVRRGVRVPEDVALIGFDDIAEARWMSPPLASVSQPLADQGRAALGLVLRQATSGVTPETVTLTTSLLPRASCGCLGHSSASLAPPPPSRLHLGPEAAIIQRRDVICAEMTRASRGLFGSAGVGWEGQLLNSMVDELRGDGGRFLPTLDRQLNQVVVAGGDVNLAHDVLSALRTELAKLLQDSGHWRLGSTLLDGGRLLISTAAERSQAQKRLAAESWIRTLSKVSGQLSLAHDLQELGLALQDALPRLGIPSFYLVDSSAQQWATLLSGYGRWGTTSAHGTRTFETRYLVPPQLVGEDVSQRWVVQPLFDGENRYGYAVFEMASAAGYAYEVLRELLTSVLRNLHTAHSRRL